jgi:hypothetical protein
MAIDHVDTAPHPPAPEHTLEPPESPLRRLIPTLVAAVFAIAYVLVSPPSLDLPAHLLRAKLFSTEGFGLWNNWWYGGHNTPGYSVLFPPVAALLTPQVAAGLATTGTAALFEPLARAHFGRRALLGATWFGAATALDLFTGRLTFAFGLLPAMAATLALHRRRDWLAAGLAVVTALASPVAALFAALAAASTAIGRAGAERRLRSAVMPLVVAAAALVPVLVLAVMFPEGGSEPFAFASLWPIPIIGVLGLFVLPRGELTLRAGVAMYVVGCILAYKLATPVGSNAVRLAPLVAGPVAALIWWPRRRLLLLVVAVPLLYLQWQAPVRDVRHSWNDRATEAAYYRPLIAFLSRQGGGPFRVEIPFTSFHWEAYEIAPRFPLARGWERQLDIKYNHIFYDHTLDADTYEAWLHSLAVHYVAVANTSLDYSAKAEVALIDRGLPYLRLAMQTKDWRVYAVRDPTPLGQGVARVTALGANSVSLQARGAGRAVIRVRFSPYWKLSGAPGCVAPDGDFTRVTLRRPGPAKLVIDFALSRIGARSPRCS